MFSETSKVIGLQVHFTNKVKKKEANNHVKDEKEFNNI